MSTTKSFAKPDTHLAPTTQHEGFTVVSAEAIEEISGVAYILRHNDSGARVMWLACSDTNRSFAIAFKTPPADDTGVFHILEHSVLCGSEHYPVKEPFVHLLKSSMQTFLNALTFSDKTMYPVASTNIADLENLMDVYLDAVFAPNIYSHPHIFEQEGWHYELDDLDAPLTYNGVVFNEMKGATSDPDDVLENTLTKALFPDTAYGFESGGNPRAIPTLTYEQFLDNHARHYNLSNSYTIFYGDLDIDRELARLNKRFSEVEHSSSKPANPLELQNPIMPKPVCVEMATSPENASVALAYVLGTFADRERVLATDIVLDALAGSNEAPLKRHILDSGIADDLSVMLYDGLLQPIVIFMLRGAKKGAADKFRDLVEERIAHYVREGIDRERLEASLASAEFALREGDFGSYGSDGIVLSIAALSGWLYSDEHATSYLHYEEALRNMKAGLDNTYFEQLLDNLICKSNHNVLVNLVPVEEGDAQEETAELQAQKDAMSSAELKQIMRKVEELRAEQDSQDTPEALATLPQLTVDDIDEPAPEPQPFDTKAPFPCIAHELDTKKINYVYHYFNLDCLTFDELPYAKALATLLGKLDTTKHSAAELDTLIGKNLGALNFFCEVNGLDTNPLYVDPKFVVGASALAEKVDALANIPSEVWSETSFANTNNILAILTQHRVAFEQSFLNGGHSAAIDRLSSYFTRTSLVREQLSGVDYYLFLKNILKNWDEQRQEFVKKLEELSRRIFTADAVCVSFVGSSEDRERFWRVGNTLGLAPSEGGYVKRLVVPEPVAKNEAFITPSNVVFTALGVGSDGNTIGDLGTWSVVTRVLSYDYLWNEVRVKGGAYGTGFKHTSTSLRQFWSYRDPAIDPTLTRDIEAASWLRTWQPTEEEFQGYVVSTVASHDAPTKARALARRQDVERFNGRSARWRDEIRAQQLACSPEKVRACADALDGFDTLASTCVFGSKEIIEASNTKLDVIDLMS